MKKFLPIGSVVLLKGATKRVMICGRAQIDMSDTYYDYSACLYPEGYQGAKEIYLFNDNDIEMVYFLGFQDPDELAYRDALARKVEEEQ